jgi:8-oxo-dGTP pyrophosphatase MutT (NUDIX family)
MGMNALQFGLALAERTPLQLSGSLFAAVALILRERKNGPEVLLIQRAQSASDPWSGHLAFPGGRRHAEDEALDETARRETLEELGFDLRLVATPLGALDHVPAPRATPARGLVIAPFVFALHCEPDVRPNQREVERVLWVELSPLLRGVRDTHIEVEHDGQRRLMPGYQVEERVLWGMSYRMLNSLLLLTGHWSPPTSQPPDTRAA